MAVKRAFAHCALIAVVALVLLWDHMELRRYQV